MPRDPRRGKTAPVKLSALPLALLLVSSCSNSQPKKRAFESEQSSEGPTATVKPAMGAPNWLGEVPALPKPGVAPSLPPIFPALGKLPAETDVVSRATIVDLGTSPPATARAANAAHYIAGGPPFARFSSAGAAFGNAGVIADTLLDRQRLVSWLELGRDLAKASSFSYYAISLRTPSGAILSVNLVLTDKSLFPAHFQKPKESFAGLGDLRCEDLEAGRCAERSRAVARIERLGGVAFGEARALAQLGADPTRPWQGATFAEKPPFDVAQMGARDVDLSTSYEMLGPLEAALDYSGDSGKASGELLKELAAQHALAATSIDSSYVGPFSYVVRTSSPEGAAKIAASLGALQAAFSAPAPSRPKPSSRDDEWNLALQSSMGRALAKAKLVTSGSEVRLDGTVVLDDAEKAALDSYVRFRGARYIALARVLDAAAQGAAPAREDLLELGGDALVDGMVARRKRAPRAVVLEPLRTFADVKIPSGGTQATWSTSQTTSVRWPDGGAELIDDVLDALKEQGFVTRPLSLTPLGPFFSTSKGPRALTVRFHKADSGGVEATFSESN